MLRERQRKARARASHGFSFGRSFRRLGCSLPMEQTMITPRRCGVEYREESSGRKSGRERDA